MGTALVQSKDTCYLTDFSQVLRKLSLAIKAQGSGPNSLTVSEIKGAHCTRRAHFHCRVHDFRRRAPGVCTFFLAIYYCYTWEGAWSNFRVHSFMGSAPCEYTNQKLNFGHCFNIILSLILLFLSGNIRVC